MNKIIKPARRREATKDKPEMTMGIDVSDRYSHICLLDGEGEVVERDRVRSTEAAFRRHFEDAPRLRIAVECGTHSPWMSRRGGYEVIRLPMKDGHATGEYEDFLTGFTIGDGDVWGRPVGVTEAQDGSIFVSDDGSKSIWHVTYTGK